MTDNETCDVCNIPATTLDGICGALCDSPECYGIAWDCVFAVEAR